MWHDVKLLNATTNALIALVLLVLLASGLWWVAQRPMFTLKTIRVEGMADTPLRRVNSLTIRASAVPRIKGNFLLPIWMPYARHLSRYLGCARRWCDANGRTS